MMVLVDASVWIDHLRNNEPRLVRLLTQNSVLIHPFVRGELALGNLRQRQVILSSLDNLPQAPVALLMRLIFSLKHMLYLVWV